MSLREVHALETDEYMAWVHRCRTDESGSNGIQRLLAMNIAVQCSTKENQVDWRDFAPWLAPGFGLAKWNGFIREVKLKAPALLDKGYSPNRLKEEYKALFPDG